jgi:hypothetical protein
MSGWGKDISLKVPGANNTENSTIKDVIGQKNDNNYVHAQTLAGQAYMAYYHVHAPAFVYPDRADSIPVTSEAGAWAESANTTEVIPAGTITSRFDLHWVQVSELAANGEEYQLNIYSGAAGAESLIAQARMFRLTNFVQEGNLPIQVPPQNAGERISVRLYNSGAGSTTANVVFSGHPYP